LVLKVTFPLLHFPRLNRPDRPDCWIARPDPLFPPFTIYEINQINETDQPNPRVIYWKVGNALKFWYY
jgi:hypothetical protein